MTKTILREEQVKLRYFTRQAEHFYGGAIPWKAFAGPSTWAEMGYPSRNLYALEVDTRVFPASKLMNRTGFLHDMQASLGKGAECKFQNSIGLALVIDLDQKTDQSALDVAMQRRCMMVGRDEGAGKTNFVRHVLRRRAGDRIWVADPKPCADTKAKWPEAEVVVGTGWNYEAIEGLVYLANNELKEFQNPRLLVVIDEFWDVARNVSDPKGFAEQVIGFATKGREVGVDVALIVHSFSVEGMKIQGMGDLRKNFSHVDLTKAGNGRFYAKVNPGDGWVTCLPPKLVEIEKLTPEEIYLVEYAYTNEPKGSFALGKMYKAARPEQFPGMSKYTIRSTAERWEQEGLLSPGKEARGVQVPRRISKKLMSLAGYEFSA